MMRIASPLSRHIGTRELLRQLDSDERTSPRTRAHLAACSRCRAELRELRVLHVAAKAMRGPAARDHLLTQIQMRIAAGDTVLLPAPDTASSANGAPGAMRSLRKIAAALVAASVLIALGWLLRPTSTVMASDLTGDLRFAPAAPHPGDSVSVVFRAAAPLAEQSTLVLRTRLRTAWDVEYNDGTHQQAIALLKRGPDGIFRGGFRLPAGVVYATFAVEDTTARHVDDHARRLWELLVSDSAGRPLPDALQQREYDLMGRNMSLAFQTAREHAQLTPDDPGAWADLFFQQKLNLGADADTALPSHHVRLMRLHRLWSARPKVPFPVVSGMLDYAAQITTRTDSLRALVRAYWRPRYDREVAVDRTDRVGVRERWWAINSVALKGADSARAALPLAETFWLHGGSRDPLGAHLGAQIARLAKDTGDARVRWIDRYAAADAAHAEYVYRELTAVPALRRVAVQRLSTLAQRLLRRDDMRRPLELTAAEAVHADSAHARTALGFLADAELALGDTVDARKTLARATADGWDRELFARAATIDWAHGDSVDATRLFARLVVDPGTSEQQADSLTRLASANLSAGDWQELLDAAQKEMRRYFLATAVRELLPSEVPLVGADGRTSLARLARNRPAVVVFWSRWCAPSRAQMAALGSLSRQLAREGAALIPVTDEPISAAVRSFLEQMKVSVPVYFDREGVARRAFNQWATPEYFVVDSTGTVRFRESILSLLPAQAAVLRNSGARAAGR